MTQDNQFQLLRQRRFGPLFLTQFLGAFNDNVFRNALIIMIAFQATDLSLDSNTLINLAAGLFILPFFLFSATAGQFADQLEKSALIRKVKLLEIGIMSLACIGFFMGSVPLLIALLFLMGFQSTLFGPLKYGILPQHLSEAELVGGNGMIEMGTFLAILLGTMLGGILIGLGDTGILAVSVTVVALATLGYLASRGIPTAAPVAPELKINWNVFTETARNIRFLTTNRTVFLSVLGISWFWFLGGAYLAQIPNYTKLTLGGNEQVVTLLLTLFSVGIGVGSMLCERMSGQRVELGLVPFGSIGLTVFGIDLYFAASLPLAETGSLGAAAFLGLTGSWRVGIDVVLLGLFGGFFIVPLYALIQSRSEPSHRSRVIAGNNIINALFMVVSAILAIALLGAGMSIPQLFLVLALMNAAVAVYIYTLVPEFLMRFLVWLLIHLVYRVDKRGLERIPERGPVLLVSNHVSYVDALVIAGCCRRPVRFVMDYRIYQLPLLNFIFRTAGTIPIAPARVDPDMLQRAYERIGEYLDAGEVVCIFPEGKLTQDGEIDTFRRGTERILARNPVPVVPLALRGLWGSFFSRKHGRAMRGLPKFWRRIEVVVGAPRAATEATIEALQAEVGALRGDVR